jgi:hypothetical protein
MKQSVTCHGHCKVKCQIKDAGKTREGGMEKKEENRHI